jgi:hypothetical protein
VHDISPCLNIAGGTAEMREHWQPYMEGEIFGPLRSRGVRDLHHDIHDAPGVNIQGDLCDPALQQRLADVGARLVMCCNLVEHVPDRAPVIRLLDG